MSIEVKNWPPILNGEIARHVSGIEDDAAYPIYAALWRDEAITVKVFHVNGEDEIVLTKSTASKLIDALKELLK